MSRQNIYDQPDFFAGYQQIRQRQDNANDLIETPALMQLLPDLTDKRLLDLGCGAGDHCQLFIECGAAHVLGVDLSKKMLALAQHQHAHPAIRYQRLAMEDISQLQGPFDVVVSSLAFHYVADYPALVADIYQLLAPGGVLVFSQEHPLVTCHETGERWTYDKDGQKRYANIAHYSHEGQRQTDWLVDHVIKYHRTFETLINTLLDKGFRLQQIVEPHGSPAVRAQYPRYEDTRHRPDFLVIRAVREG